MIVYAGIDEAGYGPMFGPLVVGRSVLAIERDRVDSHLVDYPDQLWDRLSQAVCRTLSDRRGRIAVNDSKKLRTAASGIRHLEIGSLAFAALAGHRPESVDQWLDLLGERCHHDLAATPWYQPDQDQPWAALPCTVAQGELAVARGLLTATARLQGIQALDLGASVVLEDRFNQMVAATRSKASVSFTFVAGHLQAVWEQYGCHGPVVVVDRQSGRVRYRRLLAEVFPHAAITILEEGPQRSCYQIESEPGHPRRDPGLHRSMTVRFEVEADTMHMPTALASMVSKYTRELMMSRFQVWFAKHAPEIQPTAGYAQDAKRFWQQIQPILPRLAIRDDQLKRLS